MMSKLFSIISVFVFLFIFGVADAAFPEQVSVGQCSEKCGVEILIFNKYILFPENVVLRFIEYGNVEIFTGSIDPENKNKSLTLFEYGRANDGFLKQITTGDTQLVKKCGFEIYSTIFSGTVGSTTISGPVSTTVFINDGYFFMLSSRDQKYKSYFLSEFCKR